MSEKKFEFKEGDIVSFGGNRGVVTEICWNTEYPICVGETSFTRDGRLFESHTEPLLKLIERSKQKKSVVRWANVYPDGLHFTFYNTKESASVARSDDCIACVPVTIEWEE